PAELDLSILLAVDPHTVRRLQIDDRVAAVLADDPRVVPRDGAVVDADVVLFGAADDHGRLVELELAAREVARQDHQTRGAGDRVRRGRPGLGGRAGGLGQGT